MIRFNKCLSLNLLLLVSARNGLKPSDTFGKQYCPMPTLRVSQLIYKITNLWKFRLNRSSASGENNGKTHPCFRTFRRVMTCVYAFHGIIFQEKSSTITFCKTCKLFVNLWTFILFLFRKCIIALNSSYRMLRNIKLLSFCNRAVHKKNI